MILTSPFIIKEQYYQSVHNPWPRLHNGHPLSKNSIINQFTTEDIGASIQIHYQRTVLSISSQPDHAFITDKKIIKEQYYQSVHKYQE